MNKTIKFDVIIVGGGHAGVEAAAAAARAGSKTALITLDSKRIGYMPCNPAIGGIGKGHIVFEVSALGGVMPQLATKTYLEAHMLNTKKGPAVHGLRLQIDKHEYAKQAQETLQNYPNLTIIQAMADEILRDENNVVQGIKLNGETKLLAPSVVLTTGTFLNGLVHIGLVNYPSGREKEQPVTKLAESIASFNLKMGRLKTGTPPRLKRSSLNFDVMEKQETEPLDYLFEFYPHKPQTKLHCYITHTNPEVHKIIADNAHLSRILRKELIGTGPRYCPSIEDKVTRFANKESHQVFVEPESLSTDWMYPNGLSTSLPLEAQEKYIRAIKGFENAEIVQPGYAIEYDFVLPHQLKHTLELKTVPGLFLAGQINGTTGYEEAAGQGLLAGINAHLRAQQLPSFVLDRTESYIGVMVDDLVSLGIDEPYRMFTSRAERRLLLRQDNSFLRLTEKSYQLGLVSEQMYQDFKAEKALIENTVEQLRKKYNPTQLLDLFNDNQYPEKTVENVLGKTLPSRICQTIQATIKYAPYLEREEREVAKLKKHRQLKLPLDYDYLNLQGLSIELRQKLTKNKPETIAQAALIPGMTPAALSLLIVKISKPQRSA